MARKRLNTRVALLGSVVVVLLALVVVITIAYLGRDPKAYLADAESAAANHAYNDAIRNYTRAYELIDEPQQKIDILFKLATMYRALDQWPKVMGCWNRVVLEQPDHVRARLALVQSMALEAQAHSEAGVHLSTSWKKLEDKTTELLALAKKQSLSDKPLSQLEQPMLTEAFAGQGDPNLAQYLYSVRGQARYEQAAAGSVTDPMATLDQAEQDLQQVLRTDPKSVRTYGLLSKVYTKRAELLAAKADAVGQAKALQQARYILEQATQAAPDQPLSHVLLLNFSLEQAQKADSGQQSVLLQQLEMPYIRLVQRFPQSPEAYGSLAQFQLVRAYFVPADQRPPFFEKAIAAAQKANQLSPKNADRTLALAIMHYRKATMFEQSGEFDQTVAIAQQALDDQTIKETSGPLAVKIRLNRLAVYRFLATCAVEQLLDSNAEPSARHNDLLALAKKAVYQIEQIRGSGEDLEVAKWRGMLDLVNGHRDTGIRELVSVYDKMRASSQNSGADPQLCYALAHAFENTEEQGKDLEYFAMALHGGLRFTRPQVILDYLDVLGRLDRWGFVVSGANPYNVDTYEHLFGANAHSRLLRLKALLATHRMADAEQMLYGLDNSDPNTMQLQLLVVGAKIKQNLRALSSRRAAGTSPPNTSSASSASAVGSSMNFPLSAELQGLFDQQVQWVEQLLKKKPEAVKPADLASACDRLLDQGQLDCARDLCRTFLAHQPDDITGLFYQVLMTQPHPQTMTGNQRVALQEQAAEKIKDPIKRGVELGSYYQRFGQLDQAMEQFQSVLTDALKQKVTPSSSPGPGHSVSMAADLAFEIAVQRRDWSLTQSLLTKIRKLSVDGCDGLFYDARLALARQHPQQALEKINTCLEHRPIFSQGMLLRAMIDLTLKQPQDALADITLAEQWNPSNPVIAKFKVTAMLARNKAQGGNLSQSQRDEVQTAIEEALRLSPNDMDLLLRYVGQIKDSQPEKAIAIYQALQRQHPTVKNALALGTLATQQSVKTSDPDRRKFYLDIAGRNLGQAYNQEPANQAVLQAYAAYYQAMGNKKKADLLLQQCGKLNVLWMQWLMQGKYDKARAALEKAYAQQPRDPNTLRGLAALSEIYRNEDDLVRYMDDLVSVEDTASNRVNQVSVLLKTGNTPVAADRLKQLIDHFPNEPQIEMLQGWLALRQGRIQEALDRLNHFLAGQPQQALALYLRGQARRWKGQLDDAILDLTQSQQLEDRPYTRIALAQAYEWDNRWDAAVQVLQGLMAQRGYPPLAVLMLAQIYHHQHQSDELEQLYQKMAQDQPSDIRWLTRWAALDMEQGRYTEAARHYAAACTLRSQQVQGQPADQWQGDRDFAEACDGQLRALIKAGQYDQAETTASTYLKTPFAPLVHCRLAQAQQAQGHQEAAQKELTTALTAVMTDPIRLPQLVAEAVKVVGPNVVRALAEQEIQQHPDAPGGYLFKFCWARQQGQWNEALAAIDKVFPLDQLVEGQQIGWIGLKVDLLTSHYEQTQDPKLIRQAMADYQSLLQKMPKNSSVLNNLAYLMAQGEMDLSQALQVAQKALAVSPRSPIIMDTVGFVYHKMGQDDKALQLLSAACQQFELNGLTIPAEVYEHLGMTCAALGQQKRARWAYERALDIRDSTLSKTAKQRIQTAIGRLP